MPTFVSSIVDARRLARRHHLPVSMMLLSAAIGLSGCQPDAADRRAPAVPATHPLAIDTPPPVYPLALACAGEGGEVVLVVSLDAKGAPADIKVESSSRRRALDVAAVEAVRGWRFKPATNRGQPVPANIRVPVNFTAPVMRPDRCFAFDEEQRRAR